MVPPVAPVVRRGVLVKNVEDYLKGAKNSKRRGGVKSSFR
jgi:hypothetical protein